MPLVNTLQISQDLGRDVPPPPAVPMDMFKMAGSTQALVDLGLLPPEELEKTAWVSAVAKALPAIWSGAKWLGSKLWGAGGKLWGAGGKAVGAVSKPLGAAGNKAVEWTGSRLGASPEMIAKIQGLGKGMAGEAVGFGALSGGINAAMAEPGQRGEAFLRGFGSGALGGLAWRGAGNLATAGMRRVMPNAMKSMEGLAKAEAGAAPWYHRWGSKAVVGGVPFAAGMAASMYTPSFEKHEPTNMQQYAQQFAPHAGYAARLGANIAMPRMGAFPSGPGYNPNLPLPQGGY